MTTSAAACIECCSEFRESRRERRAQLQRDCWRLDCALSDAMLASLREREEWGGVATSLDRLRGAMQRTDPEERRRAWEQQQQLLRGCEEALDARTQPLLTEKWDHTIPSEVDEVLSTFDDDRQAWLRLERGWAEAREAKLHLVVLAGKARSGKTCAAARWLSKREGGRFTTAARIVALREAVGSEDRKELEVLRRCVALVIDDLDRTEVKGADQARLAEVIRCRIAGGLPTTVTTIGARSLPPALAGRARIVMAH